MWLNDWLQKRRQKFKDSQYTSGYDYAAGALLRGDKTPIALDAEIIWEYRSQFDVGMQVAIANAIEAGLVKDDRV